MPAHNSRVPSYRRNKATDRAVVTINGRDIWLGRWNSAESKAKYGRIIAEWLANGRTPPPHRPGGPAAGSDISINELIVAYLKHAEDYYRKDGEPTAEVGYIKLALRPLRKLFGTEQARDFGPRKLKTVRKTYIDHGLTRTGVNMRTDKVRRLFKWAASEEHIPAEVHEALKTLGGLKQGRTEAREGRKVAPVPDAIVDAVEPHVARQVWAMVEIQRLTGARSGEVVIMRAGDIDRSGNIWVYTPYSHKTSHRGKDRKIPIGPRGQAILKEWLKDDPDAFLFSPADAKTERLAEMRRNRKTKVQPSQKNRKKKKPQKQPGDRYTPGSYRKAILYAMEKVNAARAANGEEPLPDWFPHQLRHSFATRVRSEFGINAAQIILGHSSPKVTEIYAERDMEAAKPIMEQIG